MSEHDLLTIDEVADYLRVSERTIYDWANKGEIPCGKLGTTWRFKRSDIERWVDKKLSSKKERPAPQPIAVGDVLALERVILLDTSKKKEALDALIECISRAPQVKNKEDLAEEIYRREELMSTGIGFGVAVPHVRLESISDLVMAVGLSRRDITDYQSLDEEPIRVICMVAAHANQHGQYLKTLGAVSNVLKSQSVRKQLLAARDEETAYGLLTGAP